jgi:hypothetical protein
MSFLITMGMGDAGDGSDSTMLAVEGLGSPGIVVRPACQAYQGLGVGASYKTIILITSSLPTLEGPAADPTQWILTPTDGGDATSVTALAISGPRVVLTTTEHTNGKNYTVTVPTIGLVDVNHNPYQGPFVFDYVGVGLSPTILQARSVDARIAEVVYDEVVDVVTATDPANYSISPTLEVTSVVRVTDLIYRLTTARQTKGVSYTVTVTGVRDIEGNLI